MKYRNLGRFVVAAACISMAVSPVSALAKAPASTVVLRDGEAAVDNKMLLNDAIAYAEKQSTDNLVTKVKKYFDTKLAAAKGVSEKANATTDEINTAWSDLVDAVHYLNFVKGNPDALEAAIADAAGKKESDYTSASWAPFAAAKLAAADVLSKAGDYLQVTLDNAANALTEAAGKLEEAKVEVNKEALADAIGMTDALDESEYKPSSWAKFAKVLADAEDVYADPDATQEEVNAAVDTIFDAIGELEKKADKKSLVSAIAGTNGLNADEYTAESWGAMQDALDAANTLIDDDEASQEAVDKAASDLNKAVEALKTVDPEVVNKDALKGAIASVDTLNEADWTPESWAALQDAVKAAEDVVADDDADQAAVDAALKAINDAKDALVEAPVPVDKAALNAALARAKGISKGNYTDATWNKLQDAVKDAEAVAADEEATADGVAAAVKAINDAIAGLKTNGGGGGGGGSVSTPANKTGLNNAINEVKDIDHKNTNNITPESLKTFKDALAAANAVSAKGNASQSEVNNALDALNKAKAGLEQHIYRVYNPNNGEHLFTTDKNENDHLVSLGWKEEGVAWIAPYFGTALTRMYDANSGEHHYTADKNEIATLESLGWKNEGEKWNSASKENGVALHRLYNPNETRAGRHHYSLVDNERDTLVNLGWNWENGEGALIYAVRAAK